MYCSNCGHQLPEKAVICLQCGCAANNNYAASQQQQQQQQQPQQQYSRQDYNQACDQSCTCNTEKSPKQGIVTLVLMLLFGFLGVYRMYVGKVASGVGMALLFLMGYIPLTLWSMMTGFMVSDSFVGVHYHTSDMFFFWPWFGWFSIAFLPLFVWWLIDFVMLLKGDFTDSRGNKIKL